MQQQAIAAQLLVLNPTPNKDSTATTATSGQRPIARFAGVCCL